MLHNLGLHSFPLNHAWFKVHKSYGWNISHATLTSMKKLPWSFSMFSWKFFHEKTRARSIKQDILARRPAQHLASCGEEVVREGRSENVNGGTVKCMDAPRRLIPLHHPSPRHSIPSYRHSPIPTTSPLIVHGKVWNINKGSENKGRRTQGKQHWTDLGWVSWGGPTAASQTQGWHWFPGLAYSMSHTVRFITQQCYEGNTYPGWRIEQKLTTA